MLFFPLLDPHSLFWRVLISLEANLFEFFHFLHSLKSNLIVLIVPSQEFTHIWSPCIEVMIVFLFLINSKTAAKSSWKCTGGTDGTERANHHTCGLR